MHQFPTFSGTLNTHQDLYHLYHYSQSIFSPFPPQDKPGLTQELLESAQFSSGPDLVLALKDIRFHRDVRRPSDGSLQEILKTRMM